MPPFAPDFSRLSYGYVLRPLKILCKGDRSKGPFTRYVFKDPLLLVPKIGSCEHIENDLPTHRSVSLKNRMEIEHALTFRQKWNLKIGPSERLLPIFRTKNRILKTGSCERAFNTSSKHLISVIFPSVTTLWLGL